MRTTVVFAHPWHGSYNKAILDRVVSLARAAGDECTVIDLYKDGFNPVLSEADLKIYNDGKSTDPMVGKYIEILDNTDKIIFVFPIWWYDMPAILRGFFDKVMLCGSAYAEGEDGIYPVRNIAKSLIVTTSTWPTDDIVNTFGDPVNGTIIAGTFRAVGFGGAIWVNMGLAGSSEEERKAFLDRLSDLV